MDVKYGINDAFTLDTTLIPDFGQTNFDATVLNLGPFEQQFSEQRSFFNEGTELFNKGNMFYSRRIGGFPSKFPQLAADEEFAENPEKVKLLTLLKFLEEQKRIRNWIFQCHYRKNGSFHQKYQHWRNQKRSNRTFGEL